MKKKYTGKAVKVSLSMPTDMIADAERKAGDRWPTKYMRAIVEDDLAGATKPESVEVKPNEADAVARLYDAFLPAAAPTIRTWAEENDVDQPLLLSAILTALADYAADHEKLERGQPRRLYIADQKPVVFAPDITEAKLSEADTTMLSDFLAGKRSNLQPVDPSLNELADSGNIFQTKRRPGVTDKERAAYQGWIAEHPNQKRPMVADVEAWLTEHHPDAKQQLVHHLLSDHGVIGRLAAKRAKRPEAQTTRKRKAR